MSIWRTGRKNPHTIYEQRGPEPSNDDPFIGSLNSPADAALAVAAVNAFGGLGDDEVMDDVADALGYVIETSEWPVERFVRAYDALFPGARLTGEDT